jgi:hypothetical protein
MGNTQLSLDTIIRINTCRPHSSLGGLTPTEFAARWCRTIEVPAPLTRPRPPRRPCGNVEAGSPMDHSDSGWTTQPGPVTATESRPHAV